MHQNFLHQNFLHQDALVCHEKHHTNSLRLFEHHSLIASLESLFDIQQAAHSSHTQAQDEVTNSSMIGNSSLQLIYHRSDYSSLA